MKILRYLSRDVLIHMLAVSGVLLVIIFSGRFVKYLAEAASGDLAPGILLPVIVYRVPGFLELIVPLGLFIGILMAYGRLYMQSEMVILAAAGLSPSRLALITLAPALPVAVLVACLSLWLAPLGASRSDALLHAPESSQGFNAVTAGRFQTRRGSNQVSYAQTVSADGVLHGVFLYDGGRDRHGRLQMQVTVAETGEIRFDPGSGDRYLELHDGYRYDGYPGDLDYRVTRFRLYGQLLPEPAGGIRNSDPVDGRSTRALLRSAAAEDRAALHWRLSLPVLVPIVALVALSLSRTDHRRGRYVGMAPALLIYLAYLMLLANTRSAIAGGAAGPARMWAVHGGFLCLSLAMLYWPRWRTALRLRRAPRAAT